MRTLLNKQEITTYPIIECPEVWGRVGCGFELDEEEEDEYPMMLSVKEPNEKDFQIPSLGNRIQGVGILMFTSMLAIGGSNSGEFVMFCSIFIVFSAYITIWPGTKLDVSRYAVAKQNYDKSNSKRKIEFEKWREKTKAKEQRAIEVRQWINSYEDTPRVSRLNARTKWSSLKVLVHEDNSIVKRGVSENEFIKNLIDFLQDTYSVSAIKRLKFNDSEFYSPDICIFSEDDNIYIDVEIDEPYDLMTKKPIHYYKSNDDYRNKVFNESNWFVIRFAEIQIVSKPYECINLIDDLILNIRVFKNLRHVDFEGGFIDIWSKENAIDMARDNYRLKYLH